MASAWKSTVAAAAATLALGFALASTHAGQALAAQLLHVIVDGGTVGIDPGNNAVTVPGTVNTTLQGVNVSTQLLFEGLVGSAGSAPIDTSQYKQIRVTAYFGTTFSGSVRVGVPGPSGSAFPAEFEPVTIHDGAGTRLYDVCAPQIVVIGGDPTDAFVRVYGRTN